MVVGESGVGKSTLVNSMFLTDIYTSKENVLCPSPVQRTVHVENHHVVLEEGGVKLSLNVVDTPGEFCHDLLKLHCFNFKYLSFVLLPPKNGEKSWSKIG